MANLGEIAEVKMALAKSLSAASPRHFLRDFLPAPSSATCWIKFGQVVDSSGSVVYTQVDNNGKPAMMVACHGCQAIFCYKPNSGTSSLVNHKCKILAAAAAGQPRIDLFLKPKVRPSAHQIQHCTRMAAEMCAEDFRPFHIVACSGFRKMLQYVLDVGVQSKGRMDINDLLTDEKTVKRAADASKVEMETLLLRFVRKHIEDKLGVGSTTDLYKNKDTGIYYMTVSLSLIDQGWIMSARTLGCIEFPENMAHTGVNILAMFNYMLQQYCADAKGQVLTTTDGASNNNAIGDEYPHITCECHIISTCVQYVLDKRTRMGAGRRTAPFYEFYQDAPLHFDMIDAAKDLVRWVKQADCNTEPKLKKGCPTRWDGLLLTLDSIWVDYQTKVEQLSARTPSAKHRIEAVNYKILEEMVRFLTPFKTGSKALEATNSPTIHLSCYTRQKLLLHCAAVNDDRHVPTILAVVTTTTMIPADTDGLKEIKSRIHNQIIEKFILHPIHFAGAFLDPRQKFRMAAIGLSKDNIAAGITYIKEKMRFVGPPGTESQTQESVVRAVRAPKRARVVVASSLLSLDMVESEPDDDDDCNEQAEQLELMMIQELADYQSHRINQITTECMNASDDGLLMWWKARAKSWPILARVARSVLATSASSAKSEHNFSEVGNHVTKKRSGLKPKTVNTLMIMRSNKDLKRNRHHM